MTVPFTPPNIQPSWTFKDEGDIGAAASGMEKVLEALAKENARQDAMRQQEFENQQNQMKLQSQLSTDQVQMEHLKMQMQAMKVADNERKREHELKAGQGQAIKGAFATRAADAEDTSGLNMDAVSSIVGGPDEAAGSTLQQMTQAGLLRNPELEARDLGRSIGWFDSQGRLVRQTPKEAPFPNVSVGIAGGGGGGSGGGADGQLTNSTLIKDWTQAAGGIRKMVVNAPYLMEQGRRAMTAQKFAGIDANVRTNVVRWAQALGMVADDADVAQVANDKVAYENVARFLGTSFLSSGMFGDSRSLSDKDLQAALALAGANPTVTPETIKLMTGLAMRGQANQMRQYFEEAKSKLTSPPKGVTAEAWKATLFPGGDPNSLMKLANDLETQSRKVLAAAVNEAKTGKTKMVPAIKLKGAP